MDAQEQQIRLGLQCPAGKPAGHLYYGGKYEKIYSSFAYILLFNNSSIFHGAVYIRPGQPQRQQWQAFR